MLHHRKPLSPRLLQARLPNKGTLRLFPTTTSRTPKISTTAPRTILATAFQTTSSTPRCSHLPPLPHLPPRQRRSNLAAFNPRATHMARVYTRSTSSIPQLRTTIWATNTTPSNTSSIAWAADYLRMTTPSRYTGGRATSWVLGSRQGRQQASVTPPVAHPKPLTSHTRPRMSITV